MSEKVLRLKALRELNRYGHKVEKGEIFNLSLWKHPHPLTNKGYYVSCAGQGMFEAYMEGEDVEVIKGEENHD